MKEDRDKGEVDDEDEQRGRIRRQDGGDVQDKKQELKSECVGAGKANENTTAKLVQVTKSG